MWVDFISLAFYDDHVSKARELVQGSKDMDHVGRSIIVFKDGLFSNFSFEVSRGKDMFFGFSVRNEGAAREVFNIGLEGFFEEDFSHTQVRDIFL